MGRKKLGRVWLKRRKNPPKNDGTQTISYTLSYRDLSGKEGFRSLGKRVTTEEEAKRHQQVAQFFLTGPWSDVPKEFAKQFYWRYVDAYQVLCDFGGFGSQNFHQFKGFIERVVTPEWEKGQPPEATAKILVARAEDLLHKWSAEPAVLLWQLKYRYPDEELTLWHYYRRTNKNALDDARQWSIFHTPEEVAKKFLALAKEWKWSSDPTEFDSQFRDRYPDEYREISQTLDIRAAMKTATVEPNKIVEKLLQYGREEYDHTLDADVYDGFKEGRSVIQASESDYSPSEND
jgi:hypothetical protein